MDIKKMLIEFIITFIILSLIYFVFMIKKCKKNHDYVPSEVQLIIMLYKINYQNIDLYAMTKVVSLITCISLSLTITILGNMFNSVIINLILGVVGSILISLILYNFVGNYYKKKSLKKKTIVKKK